MRTKHTLTFSFLLFFFSMTSPLVAQKKAVVDLTPPGATQAQSDDKSRPGAVKLTEAQVDSMNKAKAEAVQAILQGGMSTPLPVDYDNPDSFFEEGFLGTLKAGLLAIIATLGAFVPKLRSFASSVKGGKIISSAAIAFVALTVLITFRSGGLTENFFQMVTKEFLPNFAYAGLLYSVYKLIIGFLNRKKEESVPA